MGTIQLNVTPSEAQARLKKDGLEIFRWTGSKVLPEMAAGDYELEAAAQGYLPLKKRITIINGKPNRETITLSPVSGSGWETAGSTVNMVFVEGGTFPMGSNESDNEKPIHQVTVKGFFIDAYAVTAEQYRAFCTATGAKMPPPPDWGWNDDDPIVNVNWNEAMAYAKWVGKRLPTEAEWEYAARGGKKSIGYKYSGSNDIDEVAWYDKNAGSRTHPVGTKRPNELGIYDMSGNIWEWCWDWYGPYAPAAQTDPRGPSTGSSRVLRGGSFSSPVSMYLCRIPVRNYCSPDYCYDLPVDRYFLNGFRCARS